MNQVPVKPITGGGMLRAQQADPNGQRCLVENCWSKRAVHVAHVVDRRLSAREEVMSALEWNWGMEKGALNLDTRDNIFFLGASMKQMYEERRWALVPEESVVRQYLDEFNLPSERAKFPKLEESTYRYTFIPLDEMEETCITRQNIHPPTPEGFTVDVHLYPHDNMPVITSNVHPKFVILQLGMLVRCPHTPEVMARLRKRIPFLGFINTIYAWWVYKPTPCAARRLSFFPPSANETDDDCVSEYSSEGDSLCTPPRRIKLYGKPRHPEDVPPQTVAVPLTSQRDLPGTVKSSETRRSEALSDSNSDVISPGSDTSHKQLDDSARESGDPVDKSSRKRRSSSADLGSSPPRSRRKILSYQEPSKLPVNQDVESDSGGWTDDRISRWARNCSSSPPSTPH